jgi:hypothetical protein
MKKLGKWMLGAALAAGSFAMTAVPAHAGVRIGVAIGGPVAYVPPCPGPGYIWVNGYYSNGYWVPGVWNYVGVRERVPEVYYRGRDFDRDHWRDRDRDRRWDRDRR